jgi:hypothetical protein
VDEIIWFGVKDVNNTVTEMCLMESWKMLNILFEAVVKMQTGELISNADGQTNIKLVLGGKKQ